MIDPKGVTPGVAVVQKSEDEVDMKCRRHGCPGTVAKVLQINTSDHYRTYRCTTCQHTWGINVGGHVGF